jgi:hypothetical protein
MIRGGCRTEQQLLDISTQMAHAYSTNKQTNKQTKKEIKNKLNLNFVNGIPQMFVHL